MKWIFLLLCCALLLACSKRAQLEKAAEQGDVKAQFNLGVVHANGASVPKDVAQAARWYQKSADQGYAKAQSNLGTLYAQGRGVAKDEARAFEWTQRAANHGDADAQFN